MGLYAFDVSLLDKSIRLFKIKKIKDPEIKFKTEYRKTWAHPSKEVELIQYKITDVILAMSFNSKKGSYLYRFKSHNNLSEEDLAYIGSLYLANPIATAFKLVNIPDKDIDNFVMSFVDSGEIKDSEYLKNIYLMKDTGFYSYNSSDSGTIFVVENLSKDFCLSEKNNHFNLKNNKLDVFSPYNNFSRSYPQKVLLYSILKDDSENTFLFNILKEESKLHNVDSVFINYYNIPSESKGFALRTLMLETLADNINKSCKIDFNNINKDMITEEFVNDYRKYFLLKKRIYLNNKSLEVLELEDDFKITSISKNLSTYDATQYYGDWILKYIN